MTAQLISIDDLPPLLQHITELIGLDRCLRLVEAWGGTKVYIPMDEHLDDDHWLVRCIGAEAAAALCAGLGSGDLLLPKAATAIRAARNRAIVEALQQGASTREMALRYRLTERQVWEIKARCGLSGRDPRVLDGQLALF